MSVRAVWLLVIAAVLCACTKPQSAQLNPDGISVYVNQDVAFSYVLESPETGAFTIETTLPSYVSFDPATSTLSGVVSQFAEQFSFVAVQQRASGLTRVGPYRVKLIGNPLKDQQWHLNNRGQTGYAAKAGTAGEDINLSATIASGLTGAGVKVAVSDTGVVLAHESLSPNVLTGESRNYLNDTSLGHWIGDPTPDMRYPDDAHGTAVAGLICSAGWTGKGGRGVAPGAKFAGFQFLNAQEYLSQEGTYTAAIYDQYDGDFDIFNYSWGDSQCVMSQESSTLFSVMSDGVTNLRSGKGAIYVQSSGNSYIDDLANCVFGGSGDYYGNSGFSESQTSPYTINVGALNANGVRSSYSSPGANLWVSAPGGEYGFSTTFYGSLYAEPALISTDFPGCGKGLKKIGARYSAFNSGTGNPSCNYTSTMNGTSGAAPIASGAIALMLEANPALTWRDVKYILASTAQKVDPSVSPSSHPDSSLNLSGHTYEQGWVTNAAGFSFHNWYGFGRIDVDAAVAMAVGFVSPLGTFGSSTQSTGAITVPIPDNSATGVTQTVTLVTARTIEGVQIRVGATGCASQLGFEVTSPMGTKSIIMNINSNIADTSMDHAFLTNAFYGENSAGTWTLKAIDGKAGCTANLSVFSVRAWGY